jgi:hypothetical protein
MDSKSFKHNSLNAMSVIYGQVFYLEKIAIDHIRDEMAMEVRDICQDIRHKIEMWEKTHANQFLPKTEGE